MPYQLRIIFSALLCFLSYFSQVVKTICLPKTISYLNKPTYICTYMYTHTYNGRSEVKLKSLSHVQLFVNLWTYTVHEIL